MDKTLALKCGGLNLDPHNPCEPGGGGGVSIIPALLQRDRRDGNAQDT